MLINSIAYYETILKRAAIWLKIKYLQTDNIRNIFKTASSFADLDMLREIIIKKHKFKKDKLKICYNKRKRQLKFKLNVEKAGSNKGNDRL
jgi:hypothetical protein